MGGWRSEEPVPDAIIRSLGRTFTIFHLVAFAVVTKVAPEPYIDETFHIAQCKAYCRGEFTAWNNKITTPPGL